MSSGSLVGFRAGSFIPVAVLLIIQTAPAVSAQEPEEKKVAEERVIIQTFGGESSRSFLGVNVWEVNADVVREKGLSEERGVLITSVVPGSAADKAGLEKGDVVIEYNGEAVQGVQQFIRLVRETPVGRKVTLKVIRDGKEITVTATMGERRHRKRKSFTFTIPEFRSPDIVIPDIPHIHTTWRTPRLGIVGEELEGQLADYFGVEEGVLVRSVIKDSPAARAGIRAGDVIVKVDDEKVATPREITSALREREGETVRITLVRDRKKMTVEVRLEERTGRLRRGRHVVGTAPEWKSPAPLPGRRISFPAPPIHGWESGASF